MIVSHRHRFVFIKGIKVAGTSAEIVLSQICGPEDIVTPISAVDEQARVGTAGEPRNYGEDRSAEAAFRDTLRAGGDLSAVRIPRTRFTNHMTYRDVLALVPEARDYRLLFVERSPYAKVVSYAHWDAYQHGYNRGEGLPKEASDVSTLVQRVIDNGDAMKVYNLPRYVDEDGVVRAKGWRIETLAQQLSALVAECGGEVGTMPQAKRGLSSGQLDGAALLDPAQIDYVDANFAEEFARFGYRRVSDT